MIKTLHAGQKNSKWAIFSFSTLFLAAIFIVGNTLNREQTSLLIISYTTAFFSYLFLCASMQHCYWSFLCGLLARGLLFFSLPVLSDDIYRFLWDGYLLKAGIHPFEQLPDFYSGKGIPGITNELFESLNSPNYFTVYPPLNQFVFWLAVVIGGNNLLLATSVIRLLLLLCDIGTFLLLRKLLNRHSQSLAFLFWLNPLVILEFTGNLHFEGVVIFFLLGGIYFFQRSKWLSATGFGLAIGSKLLPLIYLPFLLLEGRRNNRWSIAIGAGIIAILSLLPLLNVSFLHGMKESLDLYFRNFEFNASIYFLVREIGFWVSGYNQIAIIGPIMSLVSIITILAISIFGNKYNWGIPKTCLFILTAYLLFATTVHPWYILPLVALGVLSNYYYPIVWSFLIFLTYSGYHTEGYELDPVIVVIEYVVLVFSITLETYLKVQKVEPEEG